MPWEQDSTSLRVAGSVEPSPPSPAPQHLVNVEPPITVHTCPLPSVHWLNPLPILGEVIRQHGPWHLDHAAPAQPIRASAWDFETRAEDMRSQGRCSHFSGCSSHCHLTGSATLNRKTNFILSTPNLHPLKPPSKGGRIVTTGCHGK